MKKTTIVAYALVISFVGCKKNSTLPEENETTGVSQSNSSSQTNARTINNKIMTDFLEVASDPQMTNMNKGLYLYMEGMKEIKRNENKIEYFLYIIITSEQLK